ncbi:MAG: hypothetical protein OEX81_02310 [Candidatus Pacebacteria bacterium]|nr:hypothetical protein [Candidatus Paceibacterota bacterium]
MHIHFICSGNAFRSRLAEAYLKSKIKKTNLKISSSGINANKYSLGNGPICWYSMKLIDKNNIIKYMSWKEKQTTKEIINDVDLLVGMSEDHIKYCQKKLGFVGKTINWNIPDLNEMKEYQLIEDNQNDLKIIKLTEQIFDLIKDKNKDLIKCLKNSDGSVGLC